MRFKVSLYLALAFSFFGCSKPPVPPAPTKRVRERPSILIDQPARPAVEVTEVAKPDVENPPKIADQGPKVAANTPPEPLDLTTRYQTPATAFDRIKDFPWRDVPRNTQTFGNVPLEIGGMICLWGEENAKRGVKFPEEAKGIPVARKFDSLYLYHSGFFCSGSGSAVAKVVFQYADGSSATSELVDGTHLQDWFGGQEVPVLKDPNSKMVWRGVNSMSTKTPPAQIRFFITEISNPRPADEITTIDLVSAKGKAAYVILAMTTGPAKLLKVDSEQTDDAAKADEKPVGKGDEKPKASTEQTP
ncbi:MAG: hypothetical protein WCJ09_09990 [Planctomycetota bacterium]